MAFEELKALNASESWSVILQSYSPKLKKELAKKLSEIFGLEKRDAEQALANTPLIVLDGLTFGMAARIKNFFVKIGAVAETTNHDMIKKNCYQIVWPATPDLSFFLKDEVAASNHQGATATQEPPLVKETPADSVQSESKKTLFERLRDLDKKLEGNAAPVGQPTGGSAPVAQPGEKILPAIRREPKKDGAADREKEARTERIAQLEQHIRELTDDLAQKESLLKDAEKALQVAHDQQNASAEKISLLQKKSSEKGTSPDGVEASPSAVEELKGQVVRLEEMLVSKEKERAAIQASLLEWRAKTAELEQKLAEKPAAQPETIIPPIIRQEPEKDAAAEKEKEALLQRVAQFERHIRELTDELTQKEGLLRDAEKALQVAHDRDNASIEKINLLQKKSSEKRASPENLEASPSIVEELKGQVLRLEEMLVAKEKERAGIQASLLEWRAKAAELEQTFASRQTEQTGAHSVAVDEWKVKAAGLEQALAKVEKERASAHAAAQKWESEVTDLRKTLAAKEEAWKNTGTHLESLQSSSASRAAELDGLKAEIATLRLKESELVAQSEALQRSLTELNSMLRSREESLKVRDGQIASLEQKIAAAAMESRDFDQIRQEHARFATERATLRQEFEAKFAEQEARFAKAEEEGRRYRSRMERKVTAATRELGEWIRGVDALRQGLQKLTMFLGSDSAVQSPEKKTPFRSLLNKPATPPENNPQ